MRALVLLKMVQMATSLLVAVLLLAPTEVCDELTPAHFQAMINQSESCAHTLSTVLPNECDITNNCAAADKKQSLKLVVPKTSVCIGVDLSQRFCSSGIGCLGVPWLQLPMGIAFLSLLAILIQLSELLLRPTVSSNVDHCFALAGLLMWAVSAAALATIWYDWADHSSRRFGRFPVPWAAAHLTSWMTVVMHLAETLLTPLYGDLMASLEPPHKMYILPDDVDNVNNDDWSDEI